MTYDDLPAPVRRKPLTYDDLPAPVQTLLSQNYQKEMRDQFNSIECEIVDLFLCEPDIEKLFAEFKEKCFLDYCRDASFSEWLDIHGIKDES